MKPQCNTSADCLRELARVMDQFGIKSTYGALNSKYIVTKGGYNVFPDFTVPSNWQFAIAEVEGKPVFIGDTIYDRWGDLVVCSQEDVRDWTLCSWNPPKPAHVMVKLPWFVVAQYASCEGSYAPFRDDIRLACKAALEKLK